MSYPPSGQPNQPWNDPNQSGQPQYPPAQPGGGYTAPYPQQGGYPPQQPGYTQPQYPQQGGYPPAYAAAPTLPPPQPKKNNVGRIIAIVVSAVVLVAVLGCVALVALDKSGALKIDNSYSTNVPGPSCDKGAGKWSLADGDTALSGSCQKDGYLLSKNGNFQKVGTFFFQGKNNADFPQAYHVEVTAAIQNGDDNVAVGIEVHHQTPLGGQRFSVASNHQWSVDRTDTAGDKPVNLAFGFLPTVSKTFQLAVDVNGPVMTFSINGKQVTSVTDNTYTNTKIIGLTLEQDGDATDPISALYSQFAYKPLPDPTLKTADALATATAIAQTNKTTPYTAAVPGPGCDTGPAQWAAPAYFGDTGVTLSCQGGALAAQEAADPDNHVHTAAYFYNRDGGFPTNYSVAVDIDLSQMPNVQDDVACAGMHTRADPDQGRYRFLACADGFWEIALIDSNGKATTLDKGQGAAQSKFTMTATVTGSTLKLALNGTTVSTVTDATLTTTSSVNLVMYAPGGQAGTATFKNFVFTPQS